MKNKLLNLILLIGIGSNAAQAAALPTTGATSSCSLGRCCKTICCAGIALSLGGTLGLLKYVHENPGLALTTMRELFRNNTGTELEHFIAESAVSDSVAAKDRDEAVEIMAKGYTSLFNTLIDDPAFPTTDVTAAQALSMVLQKGQCPADFKAVTQQCPAFRYGPLRRDKKFSGKTPDHAKRGSGKLRPGQ